MVLRVHTQLLVVHLSLCDLSLRHLHSCRWTEAQGLVLLLRASDLELSPPTLSCGLGPHHEFCSIIGLLQQLVSQEPSISLC